MPLVLTVATMGRCRITKRIALPLYEPRAILRALDAEHQCKFVDCRLTDDPLNLYAPDTILTMSDLERLNRLGQWLEDDGLYNLEHLYQYLEKHLRIQSVMPKIYTHYFNNDLQRLFRHASTQEMNRQLCNFAKFNFDDHYMYFDTAGDLTSLDYFAYQNFLVKYAKKMIKAYERLKSKTPSHEVLYAEL